MKWSWLDGTLEDEYVLDDLVDLYLDIKSIEQNTRFRNQEEIVFYKHCYSCLSNSFS